MLGREATHIGDELKWQIGTIAIGRVRVVDGHIGKYTRHGLFHIVIDGVGVTLTSINITHE